MKLTLILGFMGTTFSFLSPCTLKHKKLVGPLHLEDWVADMIDDELHRQTHIKDYEREWMEKNRAAVLYTMESDFVEVQEPEAKEFQIFKKDTRLAWKDPERYCADRCITTGNCDVFEDFFELGPKEVLSFCTECVLSESEDDHCDVPDGFYDKLMP